MASTKQLTVDELLELDDDGCRYELMRGELVSMPPTGEAHASLMVTLSIELGGFVRRNGLGRSVSGDPGVILDRTQNLMLAPDFAFTRRERLESEQPSPGFVTIVPDFVVEILSPSERAGHINQKIQEYLAAGVSLIWIIDPPRRSITVYSVDQPTRFLTADDTIDGGAVLPGFQIRVGDLFA